LEKVRKLTLAPGLGLLAALLWLAAGCSPLRLLQPNQRLLTQVEVESHDLSPAQQERLLTLVQQKPNRNLPIPRLAVYQLGHSFYDSTKIRKKIERIKARYTSQLAAAGTDSAKIGKLAARRDRLLKSKEQALAKGNAIMRLGEPPVIYDPDLSRRTVDQLSIYLRSQGFFRSQVTYTDSARSKRSLVDVLLRAVQLRNKPVHAVPLRDSAGQRLHRRVTVTYQVQEGPGFTLSRYTRSIPDSGVARVVAQQQGAALLHVGDAYNEDLIGQERQRLETLLKNAGYYDFRAQFITLEADTSFEKTQVRLGLLIASPAGGHRRYRLRQVTMLTDAGQGQVLRSLAGDTARLRRRRLGRPTTPAAAEGESAIGRISTANMPAGVTPAVVADSLAARRRGRQRLAPRDTVRLDSVAFASRGPLPIKPSILARQITLRPGQLYNLNRTQRTTRQLAGLDMYRFNNVSFSKVPDAKELAGDTLARPATDHYLDALVTASASPRFAETTEFGGTYVAEKVGPFANLRLKWRNPFHGAEVLELSGRIGFEGQYSRLGITDGSSMQQNSVYTVQYGVTAALLIPKFLVPFGLGNFLNSYQPRTRFSVSQTYTSTPFYTRTNAEFTFDYLWQTSPFHQYVFTPIDAALVKTPRIDPAYRDLLESYRQQGSPLYQSFRSIYEPSFSFTSIYNSNDINQTHSARYLRVFAEVGGLTRNLYRTKTWFRGDRAPENQTEAYDFAKIAVDYRRYYKLSPLTYLAWRLNGGVAHALTPTPTASDPSVSTYTIPYDKYFFVGGSNSVRAWQPRRLGTGAYATRFGTGERDYVTEQPGELLLEGSVEYRFPVYSFIKGALFTDFGNVWTLQTDPARPGAEFNFNTFARQFAVGSGIGIRFDFTFLILRFDIATKVYDPTAPERWTIRNALTQTRNQTALNIGIGYPF
jgi:outer membrane protein assembly factor BamA